MALEDEQPIATREVRGAFEHLRDSSHFAGVDSAALAALAQGSVHFSLPAGSTLFEVGAAPEGVYLLVSGRLGVAAAGDSGWTAEIAGGELVGEVGWLLGERRSARVVALRDSELLMLPAALVDTLARDCASLALALARLCAGRLRRSNARGAVRPRPRVFALVPLSEHLDAADMASCLIAELARHGRAELVWDERARAHTASWFNRIEQANDYVVYVADPRDSGWTRQCCRQADTLLLTASAADRPAPFAESLAFAARGRGAKLAVLLRHAERLRSGAAAPWRRWLPEAQVHHLVDRGDYGRVARLLTHHGVGLVLSGGGARGFAHLGVIRALREARVPIDFVGGSSIGAIIAAGVALGWDDAEMRMRYRRSFVATNPLSDYTFPLVALTRGRKVTRLLEREFGAAAIEDLRTPFFCISANLTTGLALEHGDGSLAAALRASVAIPGILPPVFRGEEVLVDGAAIDNLPIDAMHARRPGLVLGSDVSAQRNFAVDPHPSAHPPLWRLFARGSRGPRLHIFQVLMHAASVNGASSTAAQRDLADLLFKPDLDGIDLLDWRAFDRAIELGYADAVRRLESAPSLPSLAPPPAPTPTSLTAEIERRLRALSAGQ